MRLDFSEPRNSTLINNLLQGEIDFIFFLTRPIRSEQLVTRNLRSKVIAEADKITEFQVGFESEPRFNFIESSRNFVSSFDNVPSISESKIIGRVSWRQALYRIPLSGCCMTTTSLNQLRILFSISFKVSSIKHCLPLSFAVNSRDLIFQIMKRSIQRMRLIMRDIFRDTALESVFTRGIVIERFNVLVK